MAKRTPPRISSVSRQVAAGGKVSDLAALILADRIERKMSWPTYAAWMGVKQSTLYKIAKGYTPKPQDLTVAQIMRKLKTPIKRR